jgi:hypothetical protein
MITEIFISDYLKAPKKVRQFLDTFENQPNDYPTCEKMEAGLNKLGYSIDYGLDATPFDLKPINQ